VRAGLGSQTSEEIAYFLGRQDQPGSLVFI
jgi:hypothetical protein